MAFASRVFVFDTGNTLLTSQATPWFHRIRYLELNMAIHIGGWASYFRDAILPRDLAEWQSDLWKTREKTWEVVAEMESLESLDIFIHEGRLRRRLWIEGDDERRILRPLLAVTKPKIFRVKVAWTLSTYSTGMENSAFHIERDSHNW